MYNTGPSTATRNLKGLKRRKLTQTDRHIIRSNTTPGSALLSWIYASPSCLKSIRAIFACLHRDRQIQWCRPVFVLGRLLAFESKVQYCSTRTTSNYVRKESKDLLGRLCLICLVARARTEQGPEPGMGKNDYRMKVRVRYMKQVNGLADLKIVTVQKCTQIRYSMLE